MTVATQVSKVEYTGNGVTTVFSYPFPIIVATDLIVQLVATNSIVTTLVLNTGYTVQNAGFEAGGTVTLATPAAAGVRVVITRSVPYTQPTDYKNQGSFYPRTHEQSFDRATMQIQQLATGVSNSLQLIPGANGEFVWDARGSRIINVATGVATTDAANVGQAGSGGGGGGGSGGVQVARYWEFAGNGVLTDFVISGADVADKLFYDVAVGGVAQNPDNDYDVIVGADTAGSLIRFTNPIPNGVTGWAILRATASVAVPIASFQLPVFTISGTTATLDAGYKTGHILCTAGTAVTLTLRANNGNTALDWKSGDHFTIDQKGAGQVTVNPAAGVVIERPTGFDVKTRARYSVISFVCIDPGTNTWTVGNDLAPTP